MADTKRILITCKTYPQPSLSHREVVCTAGVTEDGQFIRLYPLNFRDQPATKKFPKYSWISLEVERYNKDHRPETYKPNPDTIKILERLNTSRNWAARKEIIQQIDTSHTMCSLQEVPQNKKSLGLIKVGNVSDLMIEPTERTWSPEHEALLRQEHLFDKDRKPIEKIPYRFVCKYTCTNPECKGHRQSIIDWEFYALYRRTHLKYGNEDIATKMVKDKFINEIASPYKDLHFFVGTVRKHSSWLIIGTFYPKIDKQGTLF